jgi:hypothetical protein
MWILPWTPVKVTAMKTQAAFLLLGLSVGSFAGCAMLDNLPNPPGANAAAALKPPGITYQGASLVQSPSHKVLAAYYCPEVANLPYGSSGAVCRGFFGPRPAPEQLAFAFDLRFRISNPNKVPVPLASVLTAATVFPAATSQALGAVCTQLCPEGQPGCGASDPNACQASSRDIRSLSDFQGAAVNFLISQGLAMAMGQKPTFVAPKVSAASELDVSVRFSFGPIQLLSVLKQLAIQSADQLKVGNMPTFQIPFKLEGTVFFNAGSLGRIPVGYGPVAGTWQVPTGGLIPSVAAPAVPSAAPARPPGAAPPAL